MKTWEFRKETCSLNVEDLQVTDQRPHGADCRDAGFKCGWVARRCAVRRSTGKKSWSESLCRRGPFCSARQDRCASLRLRFPDLLRPISFSVLISASSGRAGSGWRRQRISRSVRHQINRPGNGKLAPRVLRVSPERWPPWSISGKLANRSIGAASPRAAMEVNSPI